MTGCGDPKERGVALLTMLLITAAISAVVTVLLDDIRFGIKRASNVQGVTQAQWFALGAEDFAREVIFSSWQQDPTMSTLTAPWIRDGITLPIDGGVIEGGIEDGGNCFNLNSVVQQSASQDSSEAVLPRPAGIDQFKALMLEVGVDQARHDALTSALVDWIDTNSIARARGAEDFAYIENEPPYRTANTLLSEVAELRSIQGFDLGVYNMIAPFVCALPTSDLSPLNVNTLVESDLPLLIMLSDGDLTRAAARRVLELRPARGFTTVEQFWSLSPLQGIDFPQDVQDQITVRTRYFAITVRVYYYDSYVAMTSLLEQRSGGPIRLISRRFGEPV